MPFAWLSIYAFFAAILVQSGQSKLLLVQSLFRHGARSPTHLYPNDPNPESVWTEGLGKLTQKGKLQHYMLGKDIRSLYSDFITSNPNEVVVNSTSKDRCLRSAECHLAGLYKPTPDWQFTDELDWQPIPVHYAHNDFYLDPKAPCPRAEAAEDSGYNSPPFRKFYEQNLREYNFPIPSCMYPYYEQLQHFADVCHIIVFRSPIAQKFRAGPLLGKLIENMNRKLSGKVPNYKFQVYSARDRNVISMMRALNVSNFKKPPYATTLLFELHQFHQGPHVRLLLLNSTTPQDGNQRPHLLTLGECGEFCPLEHFAGLAEPYIPKNFKEECQLDS